jgi:hypothetical protein
MSMMDDDDDEDIPHLSDTPKRVQANRQLERVFGIPRIAKRLTLSNTSPSQVETSRVATPADIIRGKSAGGLGSPAGAPLEEEQLPLMEATVNCEPFEVFVNGNAAPSAAALAEQGGRLVSKATLYFREECGLQPVTMKVDLPWEVTGTIITDTDVTFAEWDGWDQVELDAVKRRQERCGRKSSIDEGRKKWQAQERQRRQSELSASLLSEEDESDSDDDGDDDDDDEVHEMRLSTVAERMTMEITAGKSSSSSSLGLAERSDR